MYSGSPPRKTILAALLLALGSFPIGCRDEAVKSEREVKAERARQLFASEVKPLLADNCGRCHRDAVKPFMNEPPDLHDAMLQWPALVDLEAPTRSALLTKGEHGGPAWTATQAKTVQRWIALEADASGRRRHGARQAAAQTSQEDATVLSQARAL